MAGENLIIPALFYIIYGGFYGRQTYNSNEKAYQ